MLDVKLESFMSVVKNKSYTKGAEEMNLTQPAVSHHMRQLEEYYGRKLLIYSNRKLELTTAGKLLYDHARYLKVREKMLMESLGHLDDQKHEIKFGATLTIGEFTLADVLPRLLEEFSHEHLTMLVDNTSNMLTMLKEGEIRFALVEGLINKDAYSVRLLKTCAFILVASKDHPLVKRKNVILDDLLSEVLIIREKGSGSREILERGIEERNRDLLSFRDTIVMGNVNIMKRMVESGMGISMMYRDAALKELREGTLVEIPVSDLSMEREFNFVELKGMADDHENDSYYEFFSKHLAKK